MHRNYVLSEFFLVDWSSKMKTMQVFLLFKSAEKKLYGDMLALICHIRHCTILQANIAKSMLKRYIVQPYLQVN